MIALLTLPEGEEEKFIADKASEGNPVESMTVKTLRAEIAEWKAKEENLADENKRLENLASNKVTQKLPKSRPSTKTLRKLSLIPYNSNTN